MREQGLSPETLGLGGGSPGQVLAGEPGREAEVVLDPRARVGLPPAAWRSTMQVRNPSEAP